MRVCTSPIVQSISPSGDSHFMLDSPDAAGTPTTTCASDRQKPCQQDGWKFRRSAPESRRSGSPWDSCTVIRLLVRSHRKAGRSQSANPLIRRTGHEASFAPSGQSSRSSGFNTRDAPDTDVSFREQTRSAADAASHNKPILNEHCTTSGAVLSRHPPYIL